MILDIIDVFFIVWIIIWVIAGLILIKYRPFDLFKAIIFGFVIGGSVIIWGLWKSDIVSFPVWIQAGSTLALLSITMMATYSTSVTAQANRELAEATQNLLLQETKERKSKIIKEISKQVFQPILLLFKSEQMAIESGYINNSYLSKKLLPKQYSTSTPKMYFIKQIYPPDTFLSSRLNAITFLNNRYDAYATNRDTLLEKIFSKKSKVLPQFEHYCEELKKDGDKFIIPQDTEIIFFQTIANSYSEWYTGYDFVNTHRQLLITKLKELNFSEEIVEYLKIKNEFLEIKNEYISLINGLFYDWQREYLLTESDVRSPLDTNSF